MGHLRRFLAGGLVGAVALVAGCSGPQFGPDARVPVSRRYVIADGSPAGQSLKLPGSSGFNIHIKQSRQDPGAAGEARSTADATAQGEAFAQATVSKGASAQAEFKLGHRIDNHAGGAQMMAARIAFDLEQTVDASDPPDPATLAKADLHLLVIDSHKRVVSKTVVVQANSDESRGSASLPQRRDLTVRLEPGESYDVVLYARVEASAGEGQTAEVRLQVSRLEMELTFSPAAEPPSATQPGAVPPVAAGPAA
ncbi:MAG TPA: hypothetical protein PL151_05995 [Phycisphaerae bacterium]|nr:hypothetical protein [Phycisphaerae bacterium]HOJ74619.1 hypothetical protein [Phycisphaerae bacterium]HOM50518.1 hypothetical protein [Phycisphaerae bacterium]HOQ87990.1 hypothetical protein [Phycisphaerae bacterium]HPP28291.1 hypothetical protein [Phycisphaerae bacterium]